MTATLDDVTKRKSRPEPTAEKRAAEELVAREQGLSLTGPDGRLSDAADVYRAWSGPGSREVTATSPASTRAC
jgi:hypothetical protein